MAEIIPSIKDPNGNLDIERLEADISRIATQAGANVETIQDTVGTEIIDSTSIDATYTDNGAGAGTESLAVKVDGVTVEIGGSGVQVKSGGIGTTQLAAGVVTSLGKADTAVQPNIAINFGPGAVTSITIVNGQITAIS